VGRANATLLFEEKARWISSNGYSGFPQTAAMGYLSFPSFLDFLWWPCSPSVGRLGGKPKVRKLHKIGFSKLLELGGGLPQAFSSMLLFARQARQSLRLWT
jgi:hypothetical protein